MGIFQVFHTNVKGVFGCHCVQVNFGFGTELKKKGSWDIYSVVLLYLLSFYYWAFSKKEKAKTSQQAFFSWKKARLVQQLAFLRESQIAFYSL